MRTHGPTRDLRAHHRLRRLLFAIGLLVATAASASIALPAPQQPHTWTVTSTGDAGPGTLRQALSYAGVGDTIAFDPVVFPPTTPVTIALLSRLPDVTQDMLTIDGADHWVVVDGSSAGSTMTPGLVIQASAVAVRGLYLTNFTGYGIEVRGHDNTVGGDPLTGSGPIGQGNLLGDNDEAGLGLFGVEAYSNTVQGNLIGLDNTGMLARPNQGDGIHINGAHHNLITGNTIGANGSAGIQGCCTTGTAYNVISHNLIGVAVDGTTALPNAIAGVWLHDGPSHNVIGPDNVIAHNSEAGVWIDSSATTANTVTRNSIHGGQVTGIRLTDGGNASASAPLITVYNLAGGLAAGNACAGCTVEVFSDASDQGRVYEGSATANSTGTFVILKGAPLSGPHLTGTATDARGNTSAFSAPTSGSGVESVLQDGNLQPKTVFHVRRAEELAENHIGSGCGAFWTLDLDAFLEEGSILGVKRFKVSVQEGEEPIDWTRPELTIDPAHDAWITELVNRGYTVTYYLNFWDKANHPTGWTDITSRFTTEEEVQRFQEYVTFIVNHFRGRVSYYEIWSEPDNDASPVQYIEPVDYISVTHTIIPLIRQADPAAKIVVGATSYLRNAGSCQYMMSVVQSDLMPLVDVVAWHSMFGSSPEYPEQVDYYYAYPSIVQHLKDEAYSHGFSGEFRGDEITWRSPDCPWCPSEDPLYTNVTAAKYYARGVVTNRGLDLDVSPTGMSSLRRESYAAVQSLANALAGAAPQATTLTVQTTITQVVSYTFAYADGSRLIALWDDGVAVDDDPGNSATLTLRGFAGRIATGIDIMRTQAQSLITVDNGQDLVIPGLRLRDYPLLLRVLPLWRVYLPYVIR